tara:strand:- start:10284 stop:11426 length:1143 start_codon:yes stop_codon:yes gene_type:complete
MKSRFSYLPRFIQQLILWIPRIQFNLWQKKRTNRKVCIYKADRIGDFVLAMGAIRFFAEKYGEEEIVLVVSTISRELARAEFPNITIVTVKPFGGTLCWMAHYEWFYFRRFINRYHFDHLICLRHHRLDYDDILLSWISCEKSIGIKCAVLNKEELIWHFEFTTELNYPHSRNGQFSKELMASKEMLASFGLHDNSRILPAFNTFEVKAGNYLLCSPFASHIEKDFPRETFCDVIKENDVLQRGNVVITSTKSDADKIENLIEYLETEGVSNKSIRIESSFPKSMVDYIRLIAEAKAVLTVDTATAHIAIAMDKPTVILMGGGHFDFFGPWSKSEKQRWVYNKMDCYGCEWFCSKSDNYCIKDISSMQIIEAMKEVTRYE